MAETLNVTCKSTEPETVMTEQIIYLGEGHRVKEAEEVRKVVNEYFAAHSQAVAWWLS
jgi:hypothetical protein